MSATGKTDDEVIYSARETEITEHFIYTRLADASTIPHNRDVLRRIAENELSHYRILRQYTGRDASLLRDGFVRGREAYRISLVRNQPGGRGYELTN